MKTLLPLLCLLGCLGSQGCTEASFAEGIVNQLGERDQWSVAGIDEERLGLLTKEAEAGDTTAQALVGVAFVVGDGCVPEDFEAGVAWLRRAAQAGDLNAQYLLGQALLDLDLSADEESYRSQKKREAEGFKYTLKAAERGHTGAMHEASVCFALGFVTEKDPDEARRWAYEAALRGHQKTQRELGFWLGWGVGVWVEDQVEGHAWQLVSGRSSESATELSRKMSPKQIAQAQDRAKELLRDIEQKQKKAK